MEICLVQEPAEDFVACLFRGSSAVGALHTLAYEMENSDVNEELSPYASELLNAVLLSIPRWLTSRLSLVAPGVVIDREAIIASTTEFVREKLSELLRIDVDDQRANPLHILRQSTIFATTALSEAGIEPAHRDDFDRQSMPNDIYALGPLTWRDLSEDVHDAGITWGAWKAATVLIRRRAEGKLS
jgi:hypothetical protein